MRLLLPLLWLALTPCAVVAENWPCWRGPRLDGTSVDGGYPLGLNAESELWRAELPGVGHASPIVWNELLFTVAGVGEERVLLCVDRAVGKVLWQAVVLKSAAEAVHRLNSLASSTPATDGERVYTAFLDQTETEQTRAVNAAKAPAKGEVRKGTVVVSAHDYGGKLVWQVRPGLFSSKHGFCSSPVIYEDKVIVNCDHDGEGYIVALARATGEELWRILRPNNTRSYCVPLLRELGGRPQMILSGSKCVASYDPRSGALHWIIRGPTEQFVASVVHSEETGWLYMTGGFPDHHLLAIRPEGSGDVTETHIPWRTNKGVAYVPSPIIEGGRLLIVSDSGVGHCFDARSGEVLWEERMREHHASLVSAGGRVLFINDFGTARWVKPGVAYECVGECELGQKVFASPALSEGQVFVRGEKALVCYGRRVVK
jgi:outer membrane protein assembly factor BamB